MVQYFQTTNGYPGGVRREDGNLIFGELFSKNCMKIPTIWVADDVLSIYL